jgi:hypothetical protein
MKREIRQRCGFGCVLCGIRIYQYDHIIDYAQVQEHTADNITLLCDGRRGRSVLRFFALIVRWDEFARN